MKEIVTDELLKMLEGIKKVDELTACVDEVEEDPMYSDVSLFLDKKLTEMKLEKSKVIERSGLSRTYAYQILQGERKPGRDRLISLCIAMGLSLEDTQRALAIANLGKLYPKKRRDAILIFAIQKRLDPLEVNSLLYDLDEATLINQ